MCFTGIVGRHEGSIETLRGEYMTVQKKLSHAEITVENLREERTLLKVGYLFLIILYSFF